MGHLDRDGHRRRPLTFWNMFGGRKRLGNFLVSRPPTHQPRAQRPSVENCSQTYRTGGPASGGHVISVIGRARHHKRPTSHVAESAASVRRSHQRRRQALPQSRSTARSSCPRGTSAAGIVVADRTAPRPLGEQREPRLRGRRGNPPTYPGRRVQATVAWKRVSGLWGSDLTMTWTVPGGLLPQLRRVAADSWGSPMFQGVRFPLFGPANTRATCPLGRHSGRRWDWTYQQEGREAEGLRWRRALVAARTRGTGF